MARVKVGRALALGCAFLVATVLAPSTVAAEVWDENGGLVRWGNGLYAPEPVGRTWSAFDGRHLVKLSEGTDSSSACAIDKRGRAVCFGGDGNGQLGGVTNYGQLGVGSRLRTGGPAAVDHSRHLAGRRLASIATGDRHSCAIDGAGRGYCWGLAQRGQTGNGWRRGRVWTPTPVVADGALADKRLVRMTVGGEHTCAIADNAKAYCWGADVFGQLGSTTPGRNTVPARVYTGGALHDRRLVDITAGANFTCAADDRGAAYCWGANHRGQLGNGFGPGKRLRPVRVSRIGPRSGHRITELAAGNNHICGVSAGGAAYCWGSNSAGQLGDGTTDRSGRPQRVSALAGRHVIEISASEFTTCALTRSGAVWCWGRLNKAVSEVPERIHLGALAQGERVNDLTTVDAGGCAFTDRGNIFCWGTSYEFRLKNVREPQQVPQGPTPLEGTTIVDLSAGFGHTCGLAATGQLYCWGWNFWGQTGMGRPPPSYQPHPVEGGALQGAIITDVDVGSVTSCAVSDAGDAYCWGKGSKGELGNGQRVRRAYFPVAVDMTGALTGKHLVEISVGYDHTCAIDSDGLLFCWGANFRGQLGLGTEDRALTPQLVGGPLTGKRVVDVTAGVYATCAMTAGGRAFCWGDNSSGQLGDGTTERRLAPVAVDTTGVLDGKTLSDIDLTYRTTCAVDTEGRAYCWGFGNGRTLGDGTGKYVNRVPRAVHTAGVLNQVRLASVQTAEGSVCALSVAGRAYCWGGNYFGLLGTGSDDYPKYPAAVALEGPLRDARLNHIAIEDERVWAIAVQPPN